MSIFRKLLENKIAILPYKSNIALSIALIVDGVWICISMHHKTISMREQNDKL